MSTPKNSPIAHPVEPNFKQPKAGGAKKGAAKKPAAKAPKAKPTPPEPPKQVEVAPKLTKLKFGTETLPLDTLIFSAKFQPREKLNADAVKDYTDIAKDAKAKGADSPFPNLKAIRRGEDVIVIGGFHRGKALKGAEYTETKVDVAVNDQITDAELFRLAVEDNEKHGARLTSEDKRHNLARALKFPEYAELTNTALADVVGASEFFVRSHRPARWSPATRKSKTGAKIKTGNIGRGKGAGAAKPGAAASAAATNLAANAGTPQFPNLDGDAASTGSGGSPGSPSSLDDEAEKALVRIATVLDGKQGYTAAGVRSSILDGSASLSTPDLKAFAGTSDNRLIRIAPLVFGLGWKPKQAFAHIDKAVTSATKLDHLINSAIGAGGFSKMVGTAGAPDTVGESIDDNPTFRVVVYDKTRFTVTVTPIPEKK